MMTTLKEAREKYTPKLPSILEDASKVNFSSLEKFSVDDSIKERFPLTSSLPSLKATFAESCKAELLKVGVVFSGGQAAGGHNVIAGVFDALSEICKEFVLYGFLGGPSGIVSNKSLPITKELLAGYRNQGGFDLIGSGRTKIETPEQMQATVATMKALDLDGLVVIGGDDSNTNAALLAEYFLKENIKTRVVGIPKTIDGDLKNQDIEVSFGFDTASKVYSEMIGNIGRDCLSAKKYYHFVKLMGRSASHIALECALKTHPNIVLISEEIEAQNVSLKSIIDNIADVIVARSSLGKDYGIVLIPEGLIEFIPEFKVLISELNSTLAKDPSLDKESVTKHLSEGSKACFLQLPELIKQQLTLDRDPHGNVQVSLIETERLIIEMVKVELQKRKKEGSYKGKFSPINHFLGYEGRAAYPSNFDCNYCYALGKVASILIAEQKSGYIVSIKNLSKSCDKWEAFATPLTKMIHFEIRKGVKKPVIKKALVELQGSAFKKLIEMRKSSEREDLYTNPGPIQYFGPEELTETIPITLALEKGQ